MSEIMEKVKNLLANNLENVDKSTIKPASRIVEDLGADSLISEEIAIAIQDEFNIDIPDKEIEKFKTVQDIVNYLSKNKT